ncbi:MAG: molecular chaperone HtpG, partial [Mucispirillum sp.]|nr:molecular chaperone HtpG [Mucispirillum sp.]
MEHCEELFPPYLRFVKGVVESNDLPLNISREILQNNKMIEIMRKNITKRVLDTLSDMKNKDYDTYVNFFKEFGRILKEGLHFEYDKKEAIADLVLAASTKTEKDKYTDLAGYISRMKEGQEEIYYILSASRQEAEASPYMERLKNEDMEVLILTDDIDDIVISALGEYKGKKFKSVVKGDISMSDEEKAGKEKKTEELSGILGYIKEHLKDHIADVRLSSRLTDSAVCLVRGDTDFDPHIEQLMKAMGQPYMASKRTMEINPNHPLFNGINEIFNKDKESEILKEYVDLLYDEALILEGAKPLDAGLFAKRVANLMIKGLK